MGSAFSKTKSKSESSRPSAVSTFDSVNDAVPANYSSPSRKTSFNSSVTTFKVHREQTQTYKAVQTATTKITSGTSTGSPRYSPVYKRPLTLAQDAQPSIGSPKIGRQITNGSQQIANRADRYDLKKKAYVLVFHHYEFENKRDNRAGSMKDMDKIKAVLRNYRTEQLKIHSNCSLRSVRKVMDDVSQKDFSNNSCLLVFIMSHGGSQDTILAHDGEWYSLHEDIVEKCTLNNSLKGKPKIFVLQACRGDAQMQPDSVKKVMSDKSDIVIFQSTYEGSVSWRDREGSFFMQEFLKLLESSDSSVDIHDINIKLNARLPHDPRFLGKDINQTPTMSTTLKKRLYFNDLRRS
uniref:Caspase family p20 domain-containing protein n=1 Tax=Anopheles atroparvus TaxID=41427 RepID=A0AAG5DIT1_ANOAO